MSNPTEIETKLIQDLEGVKLQLEKQSSLKVYFIAAIIAIFISSSITFWDRLVPDVKNGINKVVKIENIEKAKNEEVLKSE